MKMLNVTHQVESVRHNPESGITFVKLAGDEGFEWIVAEHPETPNGFVCIGGLTNGSFRLIEESSIAKATSQ